MYDIMKYVFILGVLIVNLCLFSETQGITNDKISLLTFTALAQSSEEGSSKWTKTNTRTRVRSDGSTKTVTRTKYKRTTANGSVVKTTTKRKTKDVTIAY